MARAIDRQARRHCTVDSSERDVSEPRWEHSVIGHSLASLGYTGSCSARDYLGSDIEIAYDNSAMRTSVRLADGTIYTRRASTIPGNPSGWTDLDGEKRQAIWLAQAKAGVLPGDRDYLWTITSPDVAR